MAVYSHWWPAPTPPGFLVHPALPWVEIQSTAAEEDRFLEVLAVAISSSAALDRHDLAVDAFGDSVGYPMRAVRDDVVQSLL